MLSGWKSLAVRDNDASAATPSRHHSWCITRTGLGTYANGNEGQRM